MSTAVHKLEKELCRCCHAEGQAFFDLGKPVMNLKQKEVYVEMLKSSFDIELTIMPGELSSVTFKICDQCVLRLRDAHNFKQQVMLCEQRFEEMFKSIVTQSIITDLDVKAESPLAYYKEVKEEMEPDDDGDGFDMKFDDSDDDQPVIKVKVEETRKQKTKLKTNKTKAKTKKSTSKKTATRNHEEAGDADDDGVTDKRLKGARLQKWAIQESDYRLEGDTYICAQCDKRYDKRFSLMFHLKTKHYKIPRFSCQYCKQAFMTPAPLTVHKLEEHNIDERFKCKACNAAFNTKVQLRKHINNFHMLGEKYKCEFCEYESFSFEGMYKHKFKHRTEKNFHCRFCRKSFLRKATLDLHERIHTGDRRKVCKVCGQAFVQKASLNYHMTKYHPEVNF